MLGYRCGITGSPGKVEADLKRIALQKDCRGIREKKITYREFVACEKAENVRTGRLLRKFINIGASYRYNRQRALSCLPEDGNVAFLDGMYCFIRRAMNVFRVQEYSAHQSSS